MESSIIIAFSGLKNGVHHFKFDVGDAFFRLFEGSPIERASVGLDVTFDKSPDMFVVDFSFKGTVKALCDRCMEEFDLPIKGKEQMLVKFTEEPMEDEVDLMYIQRGDSKIDLSQLVYEMLVLSIPMKKTHPTVKGKPTCDPEILKYLAPPATEEDDDSDDEPQNSIWSALKPLKDS